MRFTGDGRVGNRLARIGTTGLTISLVAATIAAVGAIGVVGATGGSASSFVPLAPCRLFDTRSGPDNVGTRSTPLQEGETVTFTVRGTNGNCTIPESATAVTGNLTVVGPSSNSFVTLWPADAPRPLTSNINVTSGQPPTGNNVVVKLSADGRIKAFNLSGIADVILDIAGYHEPASSGAPPVAPDPAESVSIDVLTMPTAIEFAAGSIWVTNLSANRVTRIDPVTSTVTAVIGGMRWPDRLVFDETNLWVATGSQIWRVDPATNSLAASIGQVDDLGGGLCFDGNHLWHAYSRYTEESGWIKRLRKVDIDSANVISELEIEFMGSLTAPLACANGSIWISDPMSSSLTKFNTESLTWTTIAGHLQGVPRVDGSNIWFASGHGGQITKFDTLAESTVVFDDGIGYSPTDTRLVDGALWTTLKESNQVLKLDATTGALLDAVNTGLEPRGIAFDGTHLWVTNSRSNTVTKFLPT